MHDFPTLRGSGSKRYLPPHQSRLQCKLCQNGPPPGRIQKNHKIKLMDTQRSGYNRKESRGFALVITLTLMVLLATLSVGLLGLSALALRTTSQGAAQAEARANARMALNLAIGQLQVELGPDSRISAPHGLAGGDSGGRPHWTAVYDAWMVPNATGSERETPESREVNFREWLVSGTNGSAPGEILLVGPGTLGAEAAAEAEVRAPLHSLNDDSGRIGWWTSDEGMKAKINAGADGNPTPAEVAQPLFHAQSAPHPDHRVFASLADFTWEDGRRKISISPGQVSLAAGLGNTGVGASFHDLTVHSEGVLADVRTGRLRRDLTQLLSRPLTELRDKPLYLANGRMNRFEITDQGEVFNQSFIGSRQASENSGGEWGINLEELALFHNIHRELEWSDGVPTLVTKGSVGEIAQDQFQMYGKHYIEAMQFIVSLQARRDGGTNEAPLYRMDVMLDAMVTLANPNDVRLRYSPGLVKLVRLLNFPYDMNLKITKADGTMVESTSRAANLQVFEGYIEGGFSGAPAAGFDLEPGEAAAFGVTDATSGFRLNIRRGFNPSGGVRMTGWNLGGAGLGRNDLVDFELVKITEARNNSNSNVYYQAWHGETGPAGRVFDNANLLASNQPDGELMNRMLPPSIVPPQIRRVEEFIDSPQPIMALNIVRNVERDSGGPVLDALPSRPFMLNEPASQAGAIQRNAIPEEFHARQLLFTAEPLSYQFRSLAAGAGGRNIYHGGGRQPGLGGSFNVVKRRIPMAPPLSLGAFENAIAAGFALRFGQPGADVSWNRTGPGVDQNATALNTIRSGFPVVAKAIGNSYTNPFLAPDRVFRPSSGNLSRNRAATDPSWMVNTALWDAWFLSGIVDGSDAHPASPMNDRRTARAQFQDLAEGTGMLRNTRYRFHPHKSPQQALEELFTGEEFNRSSLNSIGKYLLIDGAFNVNSISVEAWAAMLRSVSGQPQIGSTNTFDNPYGTLGYAFSDATSGTAGDWTGLRDLTDEQIQDLAEAIVEEVKARGPFLSMADFINRRPDAEDSSQQVLGALQAAIDKSGLNDRLSGAGRALTSADLNPLPGSAGVGAEPAAARALGAAGHLRQAGILTALGSQISVRSDTFVVRAYGEHRDNDGNVLATAWCEAVVQRVPEFVDSTDAPEALPESGINQLFGRGFRVVSFRWLSAPEI